MSELSACKCHGEALKYESHIRIDRPEYRVGCSLAPRCPASTAWYPAQAEAAAAWERLQGTGGEADTAGLADSLNDISYKDFMPYAYRGILRASAKALSSRPADGAQARIAELEAEIAKLKQVVRDGRSAVSKPPTRDAYLIEQRELRIAAWADVARSALSAASAGKGE